MRSIDISQLTMSCMLWKFIWYYIKDYRPPWPYRLPILFVVAVVPPIFTAHFIQTHFEVSVIRAGEITFFLMIPVAIWLADKINQRWLDDSDWDPPTKR